MILSNVALVLALVTMLWAWSVIQRDVSIIDPWWSMGQLLVTVSAVTQTGLTPRKVLLLVVVGAWALRLWVYLLWRARGKPEDARYAAFRRHHGPDRYWWYSYFQVFLLQGALMMLVSAPIQLAGASGRAIGPLDVAGAALALFGAGYEAVADAQLAAWKRRPDRGEVLDQGLWRWSRHPNYFGEILVAWGFWLFAADKPWGWLTILSPLLMTWLLVRVSGVAMLDAHLAGRKPAYRAYMERTSALVPWPPARG